MKAKLKATSSNAGWFDRLMHTLFAPRRVWKMAGDDGVKVKFQIIGFYTIPEVWAEHEKITETAKQMNWRFVSVPPEVR